MTDIRLSLIKGIDRGAIFHINNLIMAYIQQNGNVGSIEITKDSIVFSKFLFKYDSGNPTLHIPFPKQLLFNPNIFSSIIASLPILLKNAPVFIIIILF